MVRDTLHKSLQAWIETAKVGYNPDSSSKIVCFVELFVKFFSVLGT